MVFKKLLLWCALCLGIGVMALPTYANEPTSDYAGAAIGGGDSGGLAVQGLFVSDVPAKEHAMEHEQGLLEPVNSSRSITQTNTICNCGGPIITDPLGRTRQIHSVNCPAYKPR